MQKANGNDNKKENYGLRSGVMPPNDHDLDGFERDMMNMAANEKFRPIELCLNPI